MESDSSLSAIALTVSLAVFFLASLADACIGSVRRDRVQTLESQGASGARSLKRLATMPAGPTGAISLLGVFSLAASLLSAAFLALSFETTSLIVVALFSIGVLISQGLLVLTTRRIATLQGERLALIMAPPSRAISWLFTPILVVQSFTAQKFQAGSSLGRNGSLADASSTDVALPLESQDEPLDEHEVRMIRAVVQLDQTTAKEVMVPRMDMVAAEIGTSVADLAEQMVTNGHSRIPVYNDDLDHIQGVAYARDILGQLGQDRGISHKTLQDIIRPAFFIPESKTLEELLNEFQQERVHMAIVIDEYGGVSGLVTIEDLLEEIVGEIQDEFDTGEIEIEKVEENEYVIDARVGIDDLNELLNISVESNGFDTIGGFVYDQLGKIPSPGDSVSYKGLSIEVMSTIGRRLKRLRVKKSVASTSEV